PFCGPDGVLSVEPEAIIGKILGKLKNKAVLYVLVKWVNQTEEEATWELYTDLLQRMVVYCLAKMQESTLQGLKPRQTPLLTTLRTPYATTSYANKTVSYPPKSANTTLALRAPNTISKPVYVQPRKQMTQKEIADKRAKNLCFYCDEKFVPGHKCSEEYELEALLDEPVVQNFRESITDTPIISLHAMTGGNTYKTMRVKAYVSHGLCKGVELTSDVFILPLGGCDLVLGVQWLSILGNIKWNFKDLIMDFMYNDTRMEHLHHLQLVLQVIRQNYLYEKMSKCNFAAKQVEDLGHIISGEGVSIDPSKIIAMQKWPTPVTQKQLRGFLGLTALKVAMSQNLVSVLPDFNKPFIVETDDSGIGIVLQQGGHHIAYLSKSLFPKHQALSTYEKRSSMQC
nr:retrovirus-related Pol polyprotein from transposon 17.6 [Tanacetum cinerariifolium]